MNSPYTVEGILEQADILNEKGVDKITNLVKDKIFGGELNNENIEEFKVFVRRFTGLYYNMKDQFSDIERSSGERYFEHLRAVVRNVLNLPNPNLNKVYAALLHDSIEDTDIDFSWVSISSKDLKIALSVEAISKEGWGKYMNGDTESIFGSIESIEKFCSECEKSKDPVLKKIKNDASKKRNQVYFSHMESFDSMKNHIYWLAEEKGIEISENELDKLTQDTLDVKFADRIHNLSTQWHPEKTDWVKRKMEETEKYFLPVAKETNPEAYEQMISHLSRLKVQLFGVQETANKVGNTLKIES